MQCSNAQISVEIRFSNSVILSQVKTKKITTMKKVWILAFLISIDFDDFNSLFNHIVFVSIKKIYQASVSSAIQKHPISSKILSLLCVIFSDVLHTNAF